MSCGSGCRGGSDLLLLWLWCRLAATALIQPLAWEPPYATGTALKNKTNKQTKKQNHTKKSIKIFLWQLCHINEERGLKNYTPLLNILWSVSQQRRTQSLTVQFVPTFRPIAGKESLHCCVFKSGGLCSVVNSSRALIQEQNGPDFSSYSTADMLPSLWQVIRSLRQPHLWVEGN